MAGQIIVVSGTSAAGKTTTLNTFAARSKEPYLVFGIDNLAGDRASVAIPSTSANALGRHQKPNSEQPQK